MKTVAVMQPYFFPYIGYFQLISAVDLFIVYDNIKYTKKGWINRNRILQNGKEALISLALKSDSDFLDVRDRELAADFKNDKLLNQIREAYRHAPYFKQAFPVVEAVMHYGDRNLFRFLHNSIVIVCEYLRIHSKIAISSAIQIDHSLKNQEKVIALCKSVDAKVYINSIGGMDLYSRDDFLAQDIELKFIKSNPFEFKQMGNEFIPWLSIIDVMMCNSVDDINAYLRSGYKLI